MIRVMVVDDEPLARQRLCRMIEKLEQYRVCEQASHGRQAVIKAAASHPDIVLLDIRMPLMDGIEAARHLAVLEQPPAVIFTTAFGEHALAAFDVRAIGYLLKPVQQSQLLDALSVASRPNRAQLENLRLSAQQEEATRSCIAAYHLGKLEMVDVDQVCYFRAEQKYTLMRHQQGELLINESLRTLADEFSRSFFRVHRNALVSLVQLRSLGRERRSQDQLYDRLWVEFNHIPDKVAVSRRLVPALRKRLQRMGKRIVEGNL